MTSPSILLRPCILAAVNLLYLMIWSFAAIDKLRHGAPDWFAGKFGPTWLATFPGLTATFWLLTMSEALAMLLAGLALLRGEFLGRGSLLMLHLTLVWSLFVFLQLGLGQWLTAEYNGAFQQFVYFAGTLVALQAVGGPRS